MHKERLLRLADMLEGKGPYEADGPIKRDKFYMGAWNDRLPGYSSSVQVGDVPKIPTKVQCGTTACAVGHAMFDPWFQEQGLVPRWAMEPVAPNPRRLNRLEPHYKELSAEQLVRCRMLGGWLSVQKFFQVDDIRAASLFSGISKDPIEVAENIRNFVAGYR